MDTLIVLPREKTGAFKALPKGVRLVTWEEIAKQRYKPKELSRLFGPPALIVLGPYYLGPASGWKKAPPPDLNLMWQAVGERVTGPKARTVFLVPGGEYTLEHRREPDGYGQRSEAGPNADRDAAVGHAKDAVIELLWTALPKPAKPESPMEFALIPLAADDCLEFPRKLGAPLRKFIAANNIRRHMDLDVDEDCLCSLATYPRSGYHAALGCQLPTGALAMLLPLAKAPGKELLDLLSALGAAFDLVAREIGKDVRSRLDFTAGGGKPMKWTRMLDVARACVGDEGAGVLKSQWDSYQDQARLSKKRKPFYPRLRRKVSGYIQVREYRRRDIPAFLERAIEKNTITPEQRDLALNILGFDR